MSASTTSVSTPAAANPALDFDATALQGLARLDDWGVIRAQGADAAAFLQDGMDVVMEMYDDEALSVALPDHIEATVVEADAVVKGQTASSSYKPAILDNGVRVMVPPFISAGTRIVVDVYEREYVRKAD